ncbi:condensation domain-containing protein, partial [Pseudomonas syringae pv. tagetis]|uniref:condensation domain-containing protein n=1 Tax=Pseudomonas syringae group genomosp. 7 TaxID=251699 RepID=UPI00377068D0
MGCVSAFFVGLLRITGQRDLGFVVMSHNRPVGTEGLVGIFINVLRIHSHLTGDVSLSNLLKSTSRQLLSAYYQQIPFELI